MCVPSHLAVSRQRGCVDHIEQKQTTLWERHGQARLEFSIRFRFSRREAKRCGYSWGVSRSESEGPLHSISPVPQSVSWGRSHPCTLLRESRDVPAHDLNVPPELILAPLVNASSRSTWAQGQSDMRVVKQRLKEIIPSCVTFLGDPPTSSPAHPRPRQFARALSCHCLVR